MPYIFLKETAAERWHPHAVLLLCLPWDLLSNLIEILSMSTLSTNFRNIRSKLNEFCWCQSQTEAFLAITGLWRFMIRSGQVLSLTEILSLSNLSANFRNIRLKLKQFWWWQTLSLWNLVVAIEINVFIRFQWNAYVINAPPVTYYRWEMIEISLQNAMCVRTTDYYSISSREPSTQES